MDFLDTFRHAWVLGLLVVPLGLLVWLWTRRGRAIALPLDHARSKDGRWIARVLLVFESLPALALAVAIALLAGPQRWDEPRMQRSLTNIEFCVDVSGSMLAKFGSANRYDAAMTAINEFIDYRQGDAFGLTFFGNSTLHWVPLTTDVSAFRCAPPFMRPGKLPPWFNGTEVGRALLACRKVLTSREEGDRMILLVTDGYSADLGGGRDEEIARTLRQDGIVVYAVHVAESEIPGEIVNIASVTGGQVFKTDDPDRLQQVFQSIDQMQVTRMEKIQSETLHDLAPWCWVGLALLGVSLVAAFGARYTPW